MERRKLRLAVRGSSFCDVKVSLSTREMYVLESKIGPLSRQLPTPVKVPKAILQASVQADNVSTREGPGEVRRDPFMIGFAR
jgi:hypothetical protein